MTKLSTVLALLVLPALAAAQTAPAGPLTLVDALRIAESRSELLIAARANEAVADANVTRANSARLPQVSFTGSYDRTLASEFSGVFGSESSSSGSSSSAGDSGSSDIDFSKLPFGQKNVYRGTFALQQSLYSGGRIAAQRKQADLARHNAELATEATRAQLKLEVTKAFYDAALSDRLVAIAESGLTQAAAAYDQTKLAFDAGRVPEFELLRAQVARDNQRPAVIRRRADRDTAYLRLRQLLKMPAPEPLTIDVALDLATLPAPEPFAADLGVSRQAPPKATRNAVEQADTLVAVKEAAITVARADKLPVVNATTTYGKVGYPSSGVIPGFDDFRTNASAGLSVTVPLFTGKRIEAGEKIAASELVAARAQREQARAMAGLDTETALADLAAAEASFEATAGTIQQAERANDIAALRYREGLSTQLELSDARLSLQQAQANRAVAARDLQIARARVALLKNLPIGVR